ncbi:MAG: YceI family protein [Bacteroidota bacterium]
MYPKFLYSLLGLSLLSVALISFNFTAADFYQYEGETPGVLTATGMTGGPSVFTFERWHFAEISMPDDDPTQIQAVIDIDVTSAVCDWKDLEYSVKKKKDYFHVKKFPKAMVTINGATLQEDGSYTTEAMLSLKNVEKPVTLSFTISDTKPYTIQGTGELNRRDFRFTGDGPADEVPIAFEATLPID